jgi:hypothetical protein
MFGLGQSCPCSTRPKSPASPVRIRTAKQVGRACRLPIAPSDKANVRNRMTRVEDFESSARVRKSIISHHGRIFYRRIGVNDASAQFSSCVSLLLSNLGDIQRVVTDEALKPRAAGHEFFRCMDPPRIPKTPICRISRREKYPPRRATWRGLPR